MLVVIENGFSLARDQRTFFAKINFNDYSFVSTKQKIEI